MLDIVRSTNFIPDKIYSEQGKTADNCSLAKIILYDIFWQARTSTTLNSIDATNYYDSIAYAIASLFFQAFGVPLESVESMLTAIDKIKYFIWTA